MPSKPERRNRPPLSCEPCRTRKLKCDRLMPCNTCVERNIKSTCQYAANAVRGKTHVSKQRALHDRLRRLEDSIESIIGAVQPPQITGKAAQAVVTRNAIQPSGPVSANNLFSGSSNDTIQQNQSSQTEAKRGQDGYIDPSHWVSILDDIKEVRENLNHGEKFSLREAIEDFGGDLQPEVSLADGLEHSPNVNDILAALPTRPICDMLVSRYFNSRYMVLGIVHSGKFQGEYESFWKAPHQAPILWVGLLFSILSITVHLRRRIQPNSSADDLFPSPHVLHQKTAQCLVLGGYRTANAYALEALILHLQSGYLSKLKITTKQWIDAGLVLRLAFRMGYHRDPSALPGVIPPFESEMRRRVWLHIFQLDTLLSFQVGAPSMIPADFCDAQVPQNLYDTDLHVGMSDLPPSRPSSENTPMLYATSKAGVMRIFKKIVAHTTSLAPLSYSTTITLDAEMRGAYALVPHFLKNRNIAQSPMDSSEIILNRCTIELLYLKGLVVLHRRYIRHEPQIATFEPSRRFCVEAALEILARQADLHQAFQPGGRLQEDKWMLSTLTIYDFLLAAMVICLDLSVRLETYSSTLTDGDNGLVSREMRALKKSQQIWAANEHQSVESRVASRTLDLMIHKVSERQAMFSSSNVPRSISHALPANLELPYMEPMSEMIDGTETLDWFTLDQYFQNPSIDPAELESSVGMSGLFPDVLDTFDPRIYS